MLYYASEKCGRYAVTEERKIIPVSDGDGVAELAKLLPSGSVAAVVAEKEESVRAYARCLRQTGIVLRRIPLCASVEQADATEIEPDVRLVLAVGGGAAADCAKRIGRTAGRPVFVVVTSPDAVRVLDKYCLLTCDGVLRPVEGTIPCGVAFFADGFAPCADRLPYAFGETCATAVHMFDRETALRCAGGAGKAHVREKVFDCLYAALQHVGERRRDDPALPALLAAESLHIAALLQEEGQGTVYGGADTCARTAHMLFTREDRAPVPYGECAFLFGAVLSDLYTTLAEHHGVFVPPPDNNLRAERLAEYLGLSPLVAALAAARPPANGLTAYRLNEYRDELSDLAAEVSRFFAAAKKPFRRLYADDGFSLRGILDASDVRCVLALSPDLFPVCDSALTVMRSLGLLERYL